MADSRPRCSLVQYLLTLLTAVLPTVYTDQGNELQRHLHMPSSEGGFEGGPDNRVCELRMQGMWLFRLGIFDDTMEPGGEDIPLGLWDGV